MDRFFFCLGLIATVVSLIDGYENFQRRGLKKTLRIGLPIVLSLFLIAFAFSMAESGWPTFLQQVTQAVQYFVPPPTSILSPAPDVAQSPTPSERAEVWDQQQKRQGFVELMNNSQAIALVHLKRIGTPEEFPDDKKFFDNRFAETMVYNSLVGFLLDNGEVTRESTIAYLLKHLEDVPTEGRKAIYDWDFYTLCWKNHLKSAISQIESGH